MLLFGYNLKIVIYWGEWTFGGEGIKIWWRGVYWRGDFSRCGGINKFLAGKGEGTPPNPPVGKTLLYNKFGMTASYHVSFNCPRNEKIQNKFIDDNAYFSTNARW